MDISIKPDNKYYLKRKLEFLTGSVFIIIVVAITNLIITLSDGDTEVKLALWIVAAIFQLFMWVIWYPLVHWWIKNLNYVILDDRVTIHKGILTKTKQNIPFRAVTDFVLERTLYDRYLGIGSIKVQTAGQSNKSSATGYEGNLAGLLDYDNLHLELRDRIKVFHPGKNVIASQNTQKTDNELLQEIVAELRLFNKTSN